MASSGGQPGNQNAAKGKLWQQAIKRALARAANSTVDSGLDKGADELVKAFFAGEQWAIKELGDRMDGKPAQAIVGDDDHDPIRLAKVVREIVRSNPSDPHG